MREFPQGFVITRETPDGLTKVQFLFSLVSWCGDAHIRTEQLNYKRRSRRCKWVHRPRCIEYPTPPDVLNEARERFCKMIGEMLEGCG